jgi:hypothetical protein
MGQPLVVAPAPKLALPIVITVLVFLDGHDERGSYGLWRGAQQDSGGRIWCDTASPWIVVERRSRLAPRHHGRRR